jgi:DNA repair protein RadC
MGDDMTRQRAHYVGHRERLRRRFLESDLDAIAEYEVVELLLSLVVPRRDVKPLAKRLVTAFGNLRGVLDAELEELRTFEGLGVATAESLHLLRAILARYLKEPATADTNGPGFDHLAEYCRVRLGNERVEVFRVFYLDTRLQFLGEEELERGTIDRAAVYPRQVIEGAMRRRATGLVLAHNHPSGDTSPSELDRALTRAIALAGAALDIRVVDHLVVSRDGVLSFRECGLL